METSLVHRSAAPPRVSMQVLATPHHLPDTLATLHPAPPPPPCSTNTSLLMLDLGDTRLGMKGVMGIANAMTDTGEGAANATLQVGAGWGACGRGWCGGRAGQIRRRLARRRLRCIALVLIALCLGPSGTPLVMPSTTPRTGTPVPHGCMDICSPHDCRHAASPTFPFQPCLARRAHPHSPPSPLLAPPCYHTTPDPGPRGCTIAGGRVGGRKYN